MAIDNPEIGLARLWAIGEAQRVAQMPLDEGLSACINHAVGGGEVFINLIDGDAHPTQVDTSGKFITRSLAIVNGWIESYGSVLPVTHDDFRQRSRFNRFNPEVRTIHAAMNRLRVVRLATPEILRINKPSVVEAKSAGLDALKDQLETLDHYAQRWAMERDRQPSYADRSFSRYGQDSRRSRWFGNF